MILKQSISQKSEKAIAQPKPHAIKDHVLLSPGPIVTDILSIVKDLSAGMLSRNSPKQLMTYKQMDLAVWYELELHKRTFQGIFEKCSPTLAKYLNSYSRRTAEPLPYQNLSVTRNLLIHRKID